MQRREITRRGFLQQTAVAAASVGAASRAAARALGANDRIGVGFIGCGGRHHAHWDALSSLKTKQNEAVEFVAACDIYRPRRDKAVAASRGTAKGYADYRELLADPNVDLVVIATPDHHHAPQAIAALRAGKHVYVEKPITHWRQFELLKQLSQVAVSAPGLLCCGTQGLSCSAWSQAKRLIADGLIGQPIHVEAGYFRVGDWGERGMHVDDPKAQPGADLDWEAFLGDAPRKPFSVDRLFRWRLFEDYAGGPVTDLYPHAFAPVVHMLGAGFPSSVVASGGIYRYPYELREVPDTFNLMIDYPEKFTVCLMGTQGNNYPGGAGRAPSGSTGSAPVVRGWEGTLTFTAKEIAFTPAEGSAKKGQTFAIERGESMTDLWKGFLDQCRSGTKAATVSPIEVGYHTQAALIMGMLACREQRVVKFDRQKEAIM
jgi:predicted dehydrogenase